MRPFRVRFRPFPPDLRPESAELIASDIRVLLCNQCFRRTAKVAYHEGDLFRAPARRSPFRVHTGPLASFVHRQSGAVAVLSIFFFVTILIVMGVAIDLMRYENQRVRLQAMAIRAVLAGAITHDAPGEPTASDLVAAFFAAERYTDAQRGGIYVHLRITTQHSWKGAMGNPAPAGARVVVLDAALASLPIAEADLGIPWNWRIGPASRAVSDETYVAQVFTPVGVGLRPFSVAHVEQPWRRPRSPGDVTIRWTRRSRALSADSWGAVEVSLAEELEAYEVEILDGAVVKRVLNASTTSALYSAANQIADWGAPLGTSDTLTVRIFQLSALVGRGAPKTVTLTF